MQIRLAISRVLLLIFAFVLTPGELIHDLYDHEDTHCQPGPVASFEPQHHHCKILQLEGKDFFSPGMLSFPEIDYQWNYVNCLKKADTVFTVFFLPNLRAPPAA